LDGDVHVSASQPISGGDGGGDSDDAASVGLKRLGAALAEAAAAKRGAGKP
jgi:hypothetical protein